MLQHLWTPEGFIGVLPDRGETISCRSLITAMPVLLGKRLPSDIQQHLVAQCRAHLCTFGLATEHPDSDEYHEHDHAYWRSSVWPPPSLMVVRGLQALGETALAKQVAEATCRGMAGCDFRENHDPLNGRGRSDLAFSWTASVFLCLLYERSQLA